MMFACMDCSVNTGHIGEYYMLLRDVWRSAHSTCDGMLCIACVERRLGRMLASKDFTNAACNKPSCWEMAYISPRMLSRISDGLLCYAPEAHGHDQAEIVKVPRKNRGKSE